VQSDASPEAIAAAVQKVQDSTADRALASISHKVGNLASAVSAQGIAISGAITLESHYQGSDALSLYRQLSSICLNTVSAPNAANASLICPYDPPPSR